MHPLNTNHNLNIQSSKPQESKDFGESLTKIGLKIQNLQNELSSYTEKAKKPVTSFRERPKAQASYLRSKREAHSKENIETKERALSKDLTKPPKTSSLHTKRAVTSLQTLTDNSQDETGSLTNRIYSKAKLNTKTKHEATNAITKEIEQDLKRIFNFYSRFGDKGAPSQLKLSKFRKMMADSNITDNTVRLEDFELLFLGHNKHKGALDFEAFLGLLPKIACIKYPSLQDVHAQALNLLLTRHILPLCKNMEHEPGHYGNLETSRFKEEQLEEGVLLVLKSIYPTLTKIYKEFFPYEAKKINNMGLVKQNSESGYWTFLKEFEICPGVIAKTVGNILWTQGSENTKYQLLPLERDFEPIKWLKEKDIGVFYKFSKFCELLVQLSFLSYQDQVEKPMRLLSQGEQVALFLEKLAFSRGMVKFAGKGSLLMSKEILERVTYETNRKIKMETLTLNEEYGQDTATEQVRKKSLNMSEELQSRFNTARDRTVTESLDSIDDTMDKIRKRYSKAYKGAV